MSPSLFTRLAVIGVGLAVATGGFLACSSNSANPTPTTPFDSGTGTTADANPPPAGDSSTPPQTDGGAATCTPDASNPLNACSPFTVNCIKFDNTRVPTGAP